jgi:cytochrome c556
MPIDQNSLEAVKAFAQKFAEYNIDFQKQAKTTQESMEKAGKVWKDSQYGQFKASVDKHIEEINSTYAIMKEYTDKYLPGLIDDLIKYKEFNLKF